MQIWTHYTAIVNSCARLQVIMTLDHLNLLHFSCSQKSTDHGNSTDHGEDADGTCVRTPETCQDSSNSHTDNGEERGDPELTHVTPLTGARLRAAQQRLQHRIPASPPALWGVLGGGHATPQTTPTTAPHVSLSASMAPSTAPADLVEHWQRIQQHVMDREVLSLLALLVQN